jgi:hypothetical protein
VTTLLKKKKIQKDSRERSRYCGPSAEKKLKLQNKDNRTSEEKIVYIKKNKKEIQE